MGIFDIILEARGDLEGQLRKLRADIETAQRERDAVRNAPAARADVKAAFAAHIAALADPHRQALKSTVQMLVRQPQTLASMASAPGRMHRPPIFGAAEPMAEAISPQALDGAFASLFGDVLAKAVDAAIDAMEWPAPEGLPMVKRTAEVERMNAQIDRLLKEEEQLIAQAEQAGLQINIR